MSSTDAPPASAEAPNAGVIELYLLLKDEGSFAQPLSFGSEECIGDIVAMLAEAPQATREGSFGFVPQTRLGDGSWLALSPDSTLENGWRLGADGVLAEFVDLAHVFASAPAESALGLRLVNIPYTPLSLARHVLRVSSAIKPLGSGASDSYDPSALAIRAGASLYTSIRGDETVPVNGEHAFTNWTLESLDDFASLSAFKTPSVPSSAHCLRSIGLSAWSPPPHPQRLRGHLAYLVVSTVEGETFHITGAVSGFWVAKSGNVNFDPSPRSPPPRGLKAGAYHSLFDLLADLSPLFAKALTLVLEKQTAVSPDIFNTLPITNVSPAASWVVPTPQHSSDPLRTQLAYLLTFSTQAELLPPARDWNDELTQFRELPSTNINEKIFRERLIARAQSDFVSAATRGVLSIANGDIPPLNPNEPDACHTFVQNNMLFTRAEDVISAYTHLGGDAAARVAASKDLRGVGILERLDIEGLHTTATVNVDYHGVRWIAQSLIPGLFKMKDEDLVAPTEEDKDDYPPAAGFRIVYGSVNPEAPDETIRASKHFGALAKVIADNVHHAEHTVLNAAGESVTLWTSTDIHGIACPDGRSYILDCFRLHCVDVEFLENDLDSALLSSDSTASVVNGTHTPPSYPHRLVFLRPELTQNYYDSKLQAWIEVQVLEAREKVAAATAAKAADTTTVAATDSEAPAVAPSPAIIDAINFKLSFNPDAFVERKPAAPGATTQIIYDPEAASTKAVRDASLYLRNVAIPAFITDSVKSGVCATDGFALSAHLHRKGINVRYMGKIASLIDGMAEADFGKVTKTEAATALLDLKQSLHHAMIARSSKHILNSLLRVSSTYDHPSVISHFFNCLLGSSLASSPVPVLPELPLGTAPTRSWTTLTPASLRAQIVADVEARFRFVLPAVAFDAQLRHVKLLREVSLRVGLQLALHKYDFGSLDAAAESIESEEEVKEDGKKKKRSVKKIKDSAPAELIQTFRLEDVLNVVPVIKSNTHKSATVDSLFDTGLRAMQEAEVELGLESALHALALNEQISSVVHPTAATKTRSLAIAHYSLYQMVQQKLEMHEGAVEVLAKMPEAERAEAAIKLADAIMEESLLNGIRAQGETFLEKAAQYARQCLIINERTVGLDAIATINMYTELSTMEASLGNLYTALRLLKHAINLWSTVHGTDHPTILRLLTTACNISAQLEPTPVATTLILETHRLTKRVHGADSMAYASSCFNLSQYAAMASDFERSIACANESAEHFAVVLGKEHATTLEVKDFVSMIERTVAQQQLQTEQIAAQKLRLQAAQSAPVTVAPVGRQIRGAKAAIVDKVADVPLTPVYSGKGELSVEELVDFIEGKKPKTKSKKPRVV